MIKTLEQEIQEFDEKIRNKAQEYSLINRIIDADILKFTRLAWAFIIAGFFVGLIGVIVHLSRYDLETLNLLGDFYGGTVASLWSLAGLFFIYVAFLGQKQQLVNQQLEIMYSQIEVKYTRLELEGQKQEMIKQNQNLRFQRFENTFFNMISIHLEMVQSLSTISFKSKGRELFDAILSSLSIELHNQRIQDYQKEYFDKYQEAFRSSVRIEFLSHYLQSLKSIYEFINASDLIDEDKKQNYFTILKSYLSYPERKFLFYFLLLGITNDSTHSTLMDMERNLMFIGTVSRNDLIKPSHLELLNFLYN